MNIRKVLTKILEDWANQASTAAAVCLMIILAFSGCANKAEMLENKKAARALVWPAPPEEPRISYVQSINKPDDVGIKRSGFSRIADWVLGADKGKEMLIKPFGIAVDEADNLCITDTGANTVCYYDRGKKKWHRWEKIGKVRWLSPVAVAKLSTVFYVADSGRRSIVSFSEQGKLLFEVTNRLERPSGIVTAGGRVWVTDSRRHAVLCFDYLGNFLSEFGKRGNAPGEFNFPTHISADAQANLYVTDSMNSRVQVFDSKGTFVRQFGKIGDSTGQFSRPKGVAVDAFQHVYVLDALFDNLQIFDAAGKFLLTVGDAGSEYGQFWLPNGIAISRQNEIFVADSYNCRLQVFKYVGGQ